MPGGKGLRRDGPPSDELRTTCKECDADKACQTNAKRVRRVQQLIAGNRVPGVLKESHATRMKGRVARAAQTHVLHVPGSVGQAAGAPGTSAARADTIALVECTAPTPGAAPDVLLGPEALATADRLLDSMKEGWREREAALANRHMRPVRAPTWTRAQRGGGGAACVDKGFARFNANAAAYTAPPTPRLPPTPTPRQLISKADGGGADVNATSLLQARAKEIAASPDFVPGTWHMNLQSNYRKGVQLVDFKVPGVPPERQQGCKNKAGADPGAADTGHIDILTQCFSHDDFAKLHFVVDSVEWILRASTNFGDTVRLHESLRPPGAPPSCDDGFPCEMPDQNDHAVGQHLIASLGLEYLRGCAEQPGSLDEMLTFLNGLFECCNNGDADGGNGERMSAVLNQLLRAFCWQKNTGTPGKGEEKHVARDWSKSGREIKVGVGCVTVVLSKWACALPEMRSYVITHHLLCAQDLLGRAADEKCTWVQDGWVFVALNLVSMTQNCT